MDTRMSSGSCRDLTKGFTLNVCKPECDATYVYENRKSSIQRNPDNCVSDAYNSDTVWKKSGKVAKCFLNRKEVPTL